MVDLVFLKNESCRFVNQLTICCLYNVFSVDFIWLNVLGCIINLLGLKALSNLSTVGRYHYIRLKYVLI